MLGLDALTHIALGDIGGYFPLHTVPPKPFLQVLVHLGASGMNRIGSIMSLPQNEFLQLLDARDAEAAIIP
jgi:hypothetical protein